MNRYDDDKIAGQRAIALFADLGAEAELKHVLAMGVPTLEP